MTERPRTDEKMSNKSGKGKGQSNQILVVVSLQTPLLAPQPLLLLITNNTIATIFRSLGLAFIFAWAFVSASIDPQRNLNPSRRHRHLTTLITPPTMASTDGTGTTEDTSPPTKRVRMNPSDTKDSRDQSSQGAAQSDSSRPAFLTPPTSASIPAPPPSSSSDAVLTHDNLCSNAASGSPKAAHARAFATPRGGGGGGGGFGNNCDSGRSPAGLMSKSEIRNLMQREAGYDIDDPQNMPKREGYLTWDDYFMAVASLSAQRSKDPHSQVGACIVDEDNRIVGIGYNGFPRGCPDDCLPWAANAKLTNSGSSSSSKSQNEEKKADDDDNASSKRQQPLPILHTRDPFMCHAEVNAILNKCSADVAGSRMYVARFPCNECAKVIIQSRIQEVVYLEDGPEDDDAYRAARIMFQMAGVSTRKYNATRSSITLDFGPLVSQEKDEPKSSSSKISEITRGGDGSGEGGGEDPCASTDQTKYKDLLMREAKYDPTGPSVVPKRGGYLSWDDYFMAVSFLSAQRSKDPNTQVGACIVDGNKCIIGIGYNGFPRGCSDECLPWSRKAKSELHKKYCYVAHAEVNAILNKCSADVRGATIYVALFPCNDCAKVIIQAGIREVVYLNDYYHDTDGCRASRIMFEMAGVKTRQYRPETRSIVVDL